MWPSQLDLRTIHVEHALLLGFFTLLSAANCVAHRGERGTLWFPVYTFAAFLGAVAILLRGSLPEVFTDAGSCTLFSLSYLFLYLALTHFYNRRPPLWRVHLLLVGLSAVASLPLTKISPSPSAKLALFSLAIALQLGLTTAFLVRQILRSPVSVQWAASLMAATLALLSANNVLRAVALLLQGEAVNYMSGSHRMAGTMLLTSVLQCAATFAFVWMTAARLHEQLHLQATTDPLTQLLNRRALATWAEREMATSRQNGWPLCAILIDLDNFKRVNDAWGHLCGDSVLCAVAELLASSVRPGDKIGRLGGDEFVVLLPRTPEEVALVVSGRLHQRLGELRVTYDAMQLEVQASFGVAELGGLGLTWEQLIHRCDKAMYSAKALGGGRVLVS